MAVSHHSGTVTKNTSGDELTAVHKYETGKPRKQKSKLNRAKKTKALSYSNHAVKKGRWQNTKKINCSVNPGLKAKRNWKKESPPPVNERKKTVKVY
ncbi:MAG TPA: hypothetical protein PLI16_00445 [Bacteroidales bacterium]|nr:hypothetical protein [Bacteroidales bacterium]HOH83056.1 hypothetical protein [Bacteroidales bacterium]